MALNMNSGEIPGGFLRSARFLAKIWDWGGSERPLRKWRVLSPNLEAETVLGSEFVDLAEMKHY